MRNSLFFRSVIYFKGTHSYFIRMINARVAQSTVLSYRLPPRIVEVPLENALDLILAEEVKADRNQPPFPRVMMDGIALRRESLSKSKSLPILGTVAAGTSERTLPAGDVCFEIMTGAVLPRNADLIIRYEDLNISDKVATVTVSAENLPSNIHPEGSDYLAGDVIISKGHTIRATTTAILASIGKTKVKVYDSPKIAILSTGDELVEIHEQPAAHQIRWSNGLSLKQQLLSYGFSKVNLFCTRDDEDEMRKAIKEILNNHEIVLLTGGVSAGKFDFVPKLLKECHVQEIFHQVAQRPGKPLWFGKTSNDQFVFGLPGNPVSCLVNLRKFVIPFIQNSLPEKVINPLKARLISEVTFKNKLTYYCLVKIFHEEGAVLAAPISGNGSGDFYQLKESDGFIELHPEEGPFTKGFLGDIYLWSKFP